MTSQLVIFRAFLFFFFFRPPDPRSEKNSRKSTNKKNLTLRNQHYRSHNSGFEGKKHLKNIFFLPTNPTCNNSWL